MRQLNKNLLQDTKRTRDNDQCTENDKRHDEDSKGGKYNDYRNRRNYSESQYQQLNHEHN